MAVPGTARPCDDIARPALVTPSRLSARCGRTRDVLDFSSAKLMSRTTPRSDTLRGTRRAVQRKGQISLRFRVVAAVALIAVVAVFAVTTDMPDASARTRPPILVSAERTGRQRRISTGSALRLGVCVVTAGSPVDKVTFTLDQGTATARMLTDDTPPYDLMGTAPDGRQAAGPVEAECGSTQGRRALRRRRRSQRRPRRPTSPSWQPDEPDRHEYSHCQQYAHSHPQYSAPDHHTDDQRTTDEQSNADQHDDESHERGNRQRRPRCIAAAIAKVNELNRQGKAVRLALQPTIYRESLVLQPGSGMTAAPITIDGQGATISGADVLGSWTASATGRTATPGPTTWVTELTVAHAQLRPSAVEPRGPVRPRRPLPRGGQRGQARARDVPGGRGREHHHRPSAGRRYTAHVRRGNCAREDAAGRRPDQRHDSQPDPRARRRAIQENMAGASNSTNFTVENDRSPGCGRWIQCWLGQRSHAAQRSVPRQRHQRLRLVQAVEHPDRGAELARNNWRGAREGFTGWSAGTKFSLTRNVTIKAGTPTTTTVTDCGSTPTTETSLLRDWSVPAT